MQGHLKTLWQWLRILIGIGALIVAALATVWFIKEITESLVGAEGVLTILVRFTSEMADVLEAGKFALSVNFLFGVLVFIMLTIETIAERIIRVLESGIQHWRVDPIEREKHDPGSWSGTVAVVFFIEVLCVCSIAYINR